MSSHGGDPAARVVVVTGAGSGLGRVVAQELLHAGHRVVLAGRRRPALEATRDAVPRVAGRGLVVPADVTDPGSVGELFDRVRRELGRADVLFNNAGIFGQPRPVEEVALEQWRAVIDTNLTGAFL